MKYTENDLLNIIQSSVTAIIDASGFLSSDELLIVENLTYSLCECPNCEQGECLAHTNAKGYIYVSRKRLSDMLTPGLYTPVGLLALMQTCLHEVIHNIYPDASKDINVPRVGLCSTLVQRKTKEIWCKGMVNIYDVFSLGEGERT